MLSSEFLIELVHQHPILYETSHLEYKNKRMKDRIWDSMAEKYGEKDGDVLKKQWKNLRDSYSKYLRSWKIIPGQGPRFIDRYKSWPWADAMSFLRPYMNSDDASNSQAPETPTPSNKVQSQLERSQHVTPEIPPRKRASKQNQSQFKPRKYLRQNALDDTDLLFQSYSKKLKQMNKRRQAVVKFKIAKIMMKAEIEECEMQSRMESGQFLDVMIVKSPTSCDSSDTNESTYIVSSPPAFEAVETLSPLSPSYVETLKTEL